MAGKIKVLGLNFGRVNGECKKYLNIALEEAKAAGAETEIIDTVTKKINRCIGCGACSRMLESGKQQIRCIQLAAAVVRATTATTGGGLGELGPVASSSTSRAQDRRKRRFRATAPAGTAAACVHTICPFQPLHAHC